MKEILAEATAQLTGAEPFALVTLVGDRGSTPRAAGATMLVRADGSIAGTIGGGLLEATMIGQAREVIARGRSRLADMSLAGRYVDGEEMLCGGTAHVLIAYVPAGDPGLLAVCRDMAAALSERRRAWSFTMFSADADAAVVSYCLLQEGRETTGELPCSREEMRELVARIGVHTITQLPDGRRVHLETLEPATVAVICGAGHVSQALAPAARAAGFETVVLDDRPEFADEERFPSNTQVRLIASFDDAFAGLTVDEHCYVVIVTRGHQHDFAVLAQALRTGAAYVGLMASRTKRQRIVEQLGELGFGPHDIARLRSPIGLPIGAETPAELAVSVVAEMIQVRAGMDGAGKKP